MSDRRRSPGAPSGSRPIAIFDSGVGGLTVFHEVARKLPKESLLYLGDSARVPYGTKSADTVIRYTREAADYLLGRGVKAIVIACNTATAAALQTLSREIDVPLVGVIEPGARKAAEVARKQVGVIATEGTVRSRAYTHAITVLNPRLRIHEQACPLFVPLAEEGWANTRVAREIAETYLSPLIDAHVDTLVLGCTHYPILRQTIRQVVGDDVNIVDSAETTAQAVADLLEERGLATDGSAEPRYEYLVTDGEERFRKIAAEFLDRELDHLDVIDLG